MVVWRWRFAEVGREWHALVPGHRGFKLTLRITQFGKVRTVFASVDQLHLVPPFECQSLVRCFGVA